MIFDIPYLANWNRIGEYIQTQLNCNDHHKNVNQVDFYYAVSGLALVCEDGALCKSEPNIKGLSILLRYIQMDQL